MGIFLGVGTGSDEHIMLEFMRDKIDNLQIAFDDMKMALKTSMPTIKYMSSAIKYFREPIKNQSLSNFDSSFFKNQSIACQNKSVSKSLSLFFFS